MSAGAEPGIAEDQTGWLDNADNLIGFLRARGFVLGTGEVLRLLALLERLREEDVRLSYASPDEIALWLAPVLCTSEAEQLALAPALASYAASFKRPARITTPQNRIVTAGPVSPARAATATIWATVGRSRLLLLSGLVLAITLLAGAIWWVSSRSDTALPSEPSGPSIFANILATLDALRFAAAPFLIRTLYLRWQGRRRPVLHRLSMPATIKVETIGVHGDQGASLFGDPDLAQAYQGLRAHRTVEGTRLDVKQTVRATIRAVGRLTRINEQRPQLPEYPMLVEEMSSSDHLATAARVLYEHLLAQGVPATLYAFAADLRRLRTAGVGRPISLGELRLHHEAEVLLLLSDGEVFWDSLNSHLRPSTEQLFRNWERLVLLTPVPLHRWSWRERDLAEAGVIVLPMTKAGVRALGNFLRAGGEPPQPALQQSPARPTLITLEGRNAIEWLQDAPLPDDAERSGLLEAIAQELPKEAFDLLRILALFPEIRVDLTLHGLTNLRLRGAAVLEREEIFSALAALPWFRHGRIPDWLRLDLVRCLDPAQRAEAAKFYSAWLASGSAPGPQSEIEIVTKPSGIFAEMRRQLRQGDAPSALKDAIFLRFSRNETLDDLDLEAPDQVAALLRPTWYSPERISLIVSSAVALAITTAALWAIPFRQQAPSSLVDSAVAAWIGCSLAAILAQRIQVFQAGKVRTQPLPIPLLLAAIGWLASLGVPLVAVSPVVAVSPAVLIPLLLSLGSLVLTMRPGRAQPREGTYDRPVFIPPLPAGAHWFAAVLVTAALVFIWIYTGGSDWLLLSGSLTLFAGLSLTHMLPAHFERMLRRLVERDVLHASRDEVQQMCTEMERVARRWAYRLGCGMALSIALAFLVAFPRPQILSRLPLILFEVLGGYLVGCYVARLICYGMIGRQLQKRNLTFEVFPGHADKAGGLSPVGDFCLHQGIIAAVPAFFLGTWLILFLVPYFARRYAHWQKPYTALLVVAISVEMLAFFYPMLFFHRKMQRSKQGKILEADKLSKEINNLQFTDPRRDNAIARFEAIERLPTWPIAPRTRQTFLFVLVISTLPFIAGVLMGVFA